MWLLFLTLFFLLSNHTFATTTVTASIGENRFTIDGYTSPNAKVELTSPNIYLATQSNSDGYFIFNQVILPREESELCFTSMDTNSRRTTPICIPPPPTTNYNTNVGPILLPPTVSLDKDKIDPNSTIITTGQGIPNSEINVYFYKVNDDAVSFPKEVQAYSLPFVSVNSDKDGFFTLSLPTAYSSNYRLYAATKFNDNYTPKSNTLIYILPSLFYIFLQQNAYLIFWIPLFLVTLIVFFTLLYLYNKPKKAKIHFLPALRHVELSLVLNNR